MIEGNDADETKAEQERTAEKANEKLGRKSRFQLFHTCTN